MDYLCEYPFPLNSVKIGKLNEIYKMPERAKRQQNRIFRKRKKMQSKKNLKKMAKKKFPITLALLLRVVNLMSTTNTTITTSSSATTTTYFNKAMNHCGRRYSIIIAYYKVLRLFS